MIDFLKIFILTFRLDRRESLRKDFCFRLLSNCCCCSAILDSFCELLRRQVWNSIRYVDDHHLRLQNLIILDHRQFDDLDQIERFAKTKGKRSKNLPKIFFDFTLFGSLSFSSSIARSTSIMSSGMAEIQRKTMIKNRFC